MKRLKDWQKNDQNTYINLKKNTILEAIDYQTIKRRVQRFNKEVEVRKYAGELIKQLSEGEDEVSFKDAYTMAYLEIVQPKLDYHIQNDYCLRG